MSDRSHLIRTAASLPVGHPDRKAILATLTKSAKIEYRLDQKNLLRFYVRAHIQVMGQTVAKLKDSVTEVNKQVDQACKAIAADLKAAGVKTATWKMPSLNETGINCVQAGLIVDHVYVMEVDETSYATAFPPADRTKALSKILNKAFKGAGLKP